MLRYWLSASWSTRSESWSGGGNSPCLLRLRISLSLLPDRLLFFLILCQDRNQIVRNRLVQLEGLAEINKLGHSLVHLTLDQGLTLLCEPLLLVRHKVTERGEGVGGRLQNGMRTRSCAG